MKVHIKTLGCKVNYVESEALAQVMKSYGFEIVDDEVCDIFVLNSCTVTNESDKKSRQALTRNRKINPENYSVIMGCYSQVASEELKLKDYVNYIVGNKNKIEVVSDIINNLNLSDNNKIISVDDIAKYKVFDNIHIDYTTTKTRGFIKIQDGCDHFCSYCIIPYARGRVRSRSVKDIKEEAKRLVDNGVKEIVLTGIEVASYGKDLENIKLIDAIESVQSVNPEVRIRLSSLEIHSINDDFIKRVKDLPGFCDHFHLSLQSGSDPVLKAMNRRYTSEFFKERVMIIKDNFKNIGLTTDIIVGFPGETDEMFNQTVNYVQDIGFSKVHVFPYSPRRNTPAAKREQIDNHIKNERAKILRSISDELEKKFIEKNKNLELKMLVEERKNGNFIGYTTNYIRAQLSTEEYSDIKLNTIVNIKNIGGNKEKWIVCSAK